MFIENKYPNFRYNLCTRSLLDIVNAYKDIANKSRLKKNNVQAFFLGYCASLSLYKHSAELIIQTAGNQLLIDKLNEAYPRTEIKGNGLNYIINNLTEPTNIKNIEIANEFFKRQLIENDNIDKPTELFPFTTELIAFTKSLSLEYESYKKIIMHK